LIFRIHFRNLSLFILAAKADSILNVHHFQQKPKEIITMPVSFFYFGLNYKSLKTRIMKKVFLLTVTAMFLLLTSEVNQLCAQTEFATVRLHTNVVKSSLYVSKGSTDAIVVELSQGFGILKKYSDQITADNKLINAQFEALYNEGFRLVSTAISPLPHGTNTHHDREIIYLLAKE